jgi:hypothetical protein
MAQQVSLNSFINPTNYNTETTTNKLYAAFLAGSTYYPPNFNGTNQATSVNPGGLFGWLIYSRTAKASPAKGLSSDTYIAYGSPNDLINDLNALSGVTNALLSTAAAGGTFSLFTQSGNILTGTTIGNDFILANTYLSYGGVLVIAGTTAGFANYTNATNNNIDVIFGLTGYTSILTYMDVLSPYTVGIFPSINDGAGFTAQNFDTIYPTAVSDTTISSRIFNVGGQIINKNIPTSTLASNTTITYTQSGIADAAGAFTRSIDADKYFLTVAGPDLSSVLNGISVNPTKWETTTTKNIYKKNRVNFYTMGLQIAFLGLDTVGATAGANTSYTSDERIGPANIKNSIRRDVTQILLKYVFDLNNSTTRSSATSDITLLIETNYNQYLDPTYTQVVCDSTNNTDNSTTLVANITVKPIIATAEFTVNVSVESSTENPI